MIIRLAESYIKGSLDGGILPVLKHFPGHGRVNTDSHIENCVSKIDLNTLSRTDILPFRNYIIDSLSTIYLFMTNHITYPDIDEYITTYSRKWLTNLSASIFNKSPLFISDDVEMFSAISINNSQYIM
jgi:beta-N-acetylhexosaminidase